MSDERRGLRGHPAAHLSAPPASRRRKPPPSVRRSACDIARERTMRSHAGYEGEGKQQTSHAQRHLREQQAIPIMQKRGSSHQSSRALCSTGVAPGRGEEAGRAQRGAPSCISRHTRSGHRTSESWGGQIKAHNQKNIYVKKSLRRCSRPQVNRLVAKSPLAQVADSVH